MSTVNWTVVGYHAIDRTAFEKLVEQEKSDEWYIDIKPMVWCETQMLAISHTRKSAVKKLGITLSDGPEPSPKKPASGKKRSTAADYSSPYGPHEWQQSNYMIFRLMTKENLAEVIASKALSPTTNGLEMQGRFQPFSTIEMFGTWEIDLVLLDLLSKL